MNILLIGDIVGKPGKKIVLEMLGNLRELERIDLLERRFTWWFLGTAVLLIIVGSAAVWALWSAGAISGQDAVAVFAGTVAGATDPDKEPG